MNKVRLALIAVGAAIASWGNIALADSPVRVRVDSPVVVPEWALLERALLDANAQACREFFAKYFDERGWLLCVERWGGDDGPDDAIENCNDWPHLHALGGADEVLDMYRKAVEGHLRQYTLAKTVDVEFARDGMYYKEFPVKFDWQHNGEGLSVFNVQGLSDHRNRAFRQRVTRYAGFYMNEDPQADNYDPEKKIIRSLFNGSRGPLLRKATGVDWAGDPIEVEHRFDLGHGERSYEEMVAHFKDYRDIVGDHPLNLLATTLPLNAYLLTGDEKYRRWVIEYVDAWRERMRDNGGVIPSNIGLDGTIGGETDGKWYGGAYGWGFSVEVPQTGEFEDRNRTHWGFIGFMNAYLLTGNDDYLQAWRTQAEVINAQKRTIDGRPMYPRMHGDQGWYGWTPEPYNLNALELYYLSMRPSDRALVGEHGWLAFLEGRDGDYPVRALQGDLARIRQCALGLRNDKTTPDTRLADDPMSFNPASVGALMQLMNGGLHVERRGSVAHYRLRYFDPQRRRAGIPDDVAALIEHMDGDSVTVGLVNVNQIEPRTVIIQAGAYGEHQFKDALHIYGGADQRGERIAILAPQFEVTLEPGCGARFEIAMDRYVNEPTLNWPWERK